MEPLGLDDHRDQPSEPDRLGRQGMRYQFFVVFVLLFVFVFAFVFLFVFVRICICTGWFF